MLLDFRLRNIDKVKPDPEMQKKFVGIEPRVVQKALPLASIVKDDPAALKDFIQYVRDSQADLIDDRQASREGGVALAVLELYEEKLGILAKDARAEDMSAKLDGVVISAEDISERINQDLPDGKKTNPKSIGKMLKVLGFDRNKKRVKTPLATNSKNDKIVRALATNLKLLAKILRRYTILDDETYPSLRRVVASVASHNGEGDNNKIIDISVTETPKTEEKALSPLHLPQTPHMPQIERMQTLSELYTATRDSPVPDDVMIAWHAHACGIPEDLAASDLQHFRQDYKMTAPPIPRGIEVKQKEHLSYLCTHGSCRECGGFDCSCACHVVTA